MHSYQIMAYFTSSVKLILFFMKQSSRRNFTAKECHVMMSHSRQLITWPGSFSNLGETWSHKFAVGQILYWKVW